ncbi:UNVERIFIED_CONTAM: Dickkopf- protein 3 [Gekko kuhli]
MASIQAHTNEMALRFEESEKIQNKLPDIVQLSYWRSLHVFKHINSKLYSDQLCEHRQFIALLCGEKNVCFTECIIDEDCENGKYCEFSGFEYKCYDCKTQHTHCSRDDECCGNQLCVWGECLKAVSRGANGTICENQRDCNSGMCCAFTKDLLFPVCTPLPGEGESCHDPSNRFLNLITWELEPDGALDRCPCAGGLTCKMQSYSSDSLCELSFNKTQNKGTEEPLLADEISLLDFLTEDIPGDYEETLINQMQEGLKKEVSVPKELDIASDRLFADKM